MCYREAVRLKHQNDMQCFFGKLLGASTRLGFVGEIENHYRQDSQDSKRGATLQK